MRFIEVGEGDDFQVVSTFERGKYKFNITLNETGAERFIRGQRELDKKRGY